MPVSTRSSQSRIESNCDFMFKPISVSRSHQLRHCTAQLVILTAFFYPQSWEHSIEVTMEDVTYLSRPFGLTVRPQKLQVNFAIHLNLIITNRKPFLNCNRKTLTKSSASKLPTSSRTCLNVKPTTSHPKPTHPTHPTSPTAAISLIGCPT